jgi:hypothetical protein
MHASTAGIFICSGARRGVRWGIPIVLRRLRKASRSAEPTSRRLDDHTIETKRTTAVRSDSTNAESRGGFHSGHPNETNVGPPTGSAMSAPNAERCAARAWASKETAG